MSDSCRSARRSRRLAGVIAATLAALSCASAPSDSEAETYLRWVAWEEPVGGEFFLVRWRETKMPLKVHLPRPPAGLFPDPEGIYDSVRDGIFDWTDVVSPGVPSFVLVDTPGEADIPIQWAESASGDWYIAHCIYQPSSRIDFNVSHILVTGRYGDRVADLHQIYGTLLHEMGHALGLAGHSPFAGDIMYPTISGRDELSPRDRATLAELYRLPIGKRIVGGRRER